jgi:uncharacterized membrane protein
MGLAIMIAGLAVFIGVHAFTTMRAQRKAMVDRLGEVPYKVVYSVLSLIGIVLISWGYSRYRAAGWIDVWYPPAWTRHVVVTLMWPASICLVAAYIPGDIKRVLKHPMLVSIKLWAFAHLTANGDLGSIILFGSFLAWAVFDRITLKRRTDAGGPPIPLGGRRNDLIALVVGTIVFLVLGLVFHPLVIGVPAMGTPAHGL